MSINSNNINNYNTIVGSKLFYIRNWNILEFRRYGSFNYRAAYDRLTHD